MRNLLIQALNNLDRVNNTLLSIKHSNDATEAIRIENNIEFLN